MQYNSMEVYKNDRGRHVKIWGMATNGRGGGKMCMREQGGHLCDGLSVRSLSKMSSLCSQGIGKNYATGRGSGEEEVTGRNPEGSIEIRLMRVEDLIINEAIANPIYYPKFWEPFEAFSHRLEIYPEGCMEATVNGEAVGYLYSHPWDYESLVPLGAVIELPSRLNCYYIHDVAVCESYRGLGIGERLALAGMRIGFREGYYRIKLISVLDSYRFWERLGFRVISEEFYGEELGRVMVYER